jgi:hypothetical protein
MTPTGLAPVARSWASAPGPSAPRTQPQRQRSRPERALRRQPEVRLEADGVAIFELIAIKSCRHDDGKLSRTPVSQATP